MGTLKRLAMAPLAASALAPAGCAEEEPIDEAGEEMRTAAEEVGEQVEETAKDIEDEFEDVSDDD